MNVSLVCVTACLGQHGLPAYAAAVARATQAEMSSLLQALSPAVSLF